MTDSNFKKGIEDLEAAFRCSLRKETLEIYFRYLRSLEDEVWLGRVDRAIQTERTFPSIAALKALGGNFADFKVL